MKPYLLLFLSLFITHHFFGQAKCGDADSYLVYAYSNVKDSYEANNISHLKYYAHKSLENFEKAKQKLKDCGCETAHELAFNSIELLAKVDAAETYEDGRFFVKRAKELAKNSIIELDKFNVAVANNTPTESINEDTNDLATLESEQLKLEQQQKALQQKALEIQRKLEAQNAKALELKKEKLIQDYESVILLNINAYNNALKTCNCTNDSMGSNDSGSISTDNSLEEIKSFYILRLKALANKYINSLNICTSTTN
ncbi:hypothetical protein [Gaetbulibacter saemankumensis]|uniref:hypothetical protein n=1 Tax=Gaetbulibacter saemankumensis TaxID=311208 RepID=UPI00040A5046|nr:hypothetical protein [Gaetbulibacter saemankumensis]